MGLRLGIIIGVLFFLGGAAGGQESVSAPEPSATVQSLPPGDGQGKEHSKEPEPMTDIHDIKPLVPVPVPVSLTTILFWAGICLLAAALIAGGWLLWKRRRGPLVQALEAILSPEDAALQQLSALSADTQAGKAFYFQLSAIFREYLHGRFAIDGLEMTTEELLPRIDTLTLEKDTKREVKTFLVSCDPVKFAGAPAHRSSMGRDLDFVKGFVEKTSSPPPEDTGEPTDRERME
jgi:hypothetical protein